MASTPFDCEISEFTDHQPVKRSRLLKALHFAMQNLSERDRRVLALHYGAHCSLEEVADLMGCSVREVSLYLRWSLEDICEQFRTAGRSAWFKKISKSRLKEAICLSVPEPPTLLQRVEKCV